MTNPKNDQKTTFRTHQSQPANQSHPTKATQPKPIARRLPTKASQTFDAFVSIGVKIPQSRALRMHFFQISD